MSWVMLTGCVSGLGIDFREIEQTWFNMVQHFSGARQTDPEFQGVLSLDASTPGTTSFKAHMFVSALSRG